MHVTVRQAKADVPRMSFEHKLRHVTGSAIQAAASPAHGGRPEAGFSVHSSGKLIKLLRDAQPAALTWGVHPARQPAQGAPLPPPMLQLEQQQGEARPKAHLAFLCFSASSISKAALCHQGMHHNEHLCQHFLMAAAPAAHDP